MKLLLSVIIAATYGLSIRLAYNFLDASMEIMSFSFFFLLPFLIGYLTVILIPYKTKHTATGAFFKPTLTCLVILVITLFFNIEGMICWVMAFPLFALLAGAGGVVAFHRKRKRSILNTEWDFEKDDWEKPGSLKISFLLLIPILAGLLEGDRISSFKEITVEKQVELNASPNVVWNTLVEKSRPGKGNTLSLANILGFPHHLNTTLEKPVVNGSRIATYEKGLTFIETIRKIQPGRLLVLEITNDPSKISTAIMDEHIVIGGKHIKLLEDEYRLEELPNGRTLLSLSSRFSINTPFNWYAGLWAEWLMSGILKEELSSLS